MLGLVVGVNRSEEHTSELQSQSNFVCRLLLEKKKKVKRNVRQDEGDRAGARGNLRLGFEVLALAHARERYATSGPYTGEPCPVTPSVSSVSPCSSSGRRRSLMSTAPSSAWPTTCWTRCEWRRGWDWPLRRWACRSGSSCT